MADTTPGTRSWFVDDFTDEVLPCAPTLEGWAAYLMKPDLEAFSQLHHVEYPADGSTYDASAILWSPDIVARRVDGRWTLSRAIEPGEDFFAVRYGEGAGWDADNIIYLSGDDEADPGKAAVGLCTELAQLLEEDDEDEQFIATGRNEYHWKITFHAGSPPTCTAERSN